MGKINKEDLFSTRTDKLEKVAETERGAGFSAAKQVISRDRLHVAADKAQVYVPSGAFRGVIVEGRLVYDKPFFLDEDDEKPFFLTRDSIKITKAKGEILKKNRIEEKKPKVPGMNWY